MRLGRVGVNLSYRRQLVLFLAPYLVGTLVLVVLPALATVAVSFTDYQAIAPPTWAGLDNFRRLAETPLVRLGLYNTLVFAGAGGAAAPAGGARAGAACWRSAASPAGSGLYRAAVYLPTIMPEAAYALVWLWILNPVYGPLNMILAALRAAAASLADRGRDGAAGYRPDGAGADRRGVCGGAGRPAERPGGAVRGGRGGRRQPLAGFPVDHPAADRPLAAAAGCAATWWWQCRTPSRPRSS